MRAESDGVFTTMPRADDWYILVVSGVKMQHAKVTV